MPTLYQGAEVPDGVELYDFEDFTKRRQLIFDHVKDTLQGRFPMSRNGIRMDIADLHYTDKDSYSLREQKEALLNDKYLARRLKGTVTLTDEKTGTILDTKKNLTLMRVPYLTERGTFIRGGNEWGTISQQRLLPGAYSRYQNNGDLETQFNVRPGTGNAFRVSFNPASAVYKFSIAGSQLHLYSLLKDMGVSDDELRERWGEGVYEANAAGYDSKVLDRAYDKIVPSWDRDKNPSRSRSEKAELIRRALDRSQVATDVVKHTLPNMFDRTKAAAWKDASECMEKVAGLSRDKLEEIATYINHAEDVFGGDAGIDTAGTREILEEDIIRAIRTGTHNPHLRVANPSAPVKAVQSLNQRRVYKKILSVIGK